MSITINIFYTSINTQAQYASVLSKINNDKYQDPVNIWVV